MSSTTISLVIIKNYFYYVPANDSNLTQSPTFLRAGNGYFLSFRVAAIGFTVFYVGAQVLHFPQHKIAEDSVVPNFPDHCKEAEGCTQHASIVDFDTQNGNATLEWFLPVDSSRNLLDVLQPQAGEVYKILLCDEQVRRQEHR